MAPKYINFDVGKMANEVIPQWLMFVNVQISVECLFGEKLNTLSTVSTIIGLISKYTECAWLLCMWYFSNITLAGNSKKK